MIDPGREDQNPVENDGCSTPITLVRHSPPVGESVGTWNWAKSTQGRLRLRDRVQLVGQFGLSAPLIPGEVLARLGRTGSPAVLGDPAEPPASDIVDAARRICQDATSDRPWLYPHSLRTFRMAMLFAQARNLLPALDAEVLWVAAMLHDIALVDIALVDTAFVDTVLVDTAFVDTVAAAGSSLRCFAARSAHRAEKLAREHGWTAAQQLRLADAVALHINVRVPPRRSVEGHLLNLGSSLDVAGNRYRSIDSAQLIAILDEAPPGDDFGEVIWQVWKADARRSKGCRTRFLQTMGLGLLISTSPLLRLSMKRA